MKHLYLAIFTTIAVLCFIAMLAVTGIWMNVPNRIVYQESSSERTERYSIKVVEHGKAYFVAPEQKQTLNRIHYYTPRIWFACFGYLYLFTAFGGFARLRLLWRQKDKSVA